MKILNYTFISDPKLIIGKKVIKWSYSYSLGECDVDGLIFESNEILLFGAKQDEHEGGLSSIIIIPNEDAGYFILRDFGLISEEMVNKHLEKRKEEKEEERKKKEIEEYKRLKNKYEKKEYI